jgi:TM2 domain-containing membrane protein YozV
MARQSQNRNSCDMVAWNKQLHELTDINRDKGIHMNKKLTALLLSGLVLPGLGQLYLGRKMVGGIIIVLVNLVLILALFVLLRGLSPLIASQIAGGAINIKPAEVMQAVDGATGFGKAVLAAFFLVWTFSIVDILRNKEKL